MFEVIYKFEYFYLKDLKSSLNIPIISQYVSSEIFDIYKVQSGKAYRKRLYGLVTIFKYLIFQVMATDINEQNALLILTEYYKIYSDNIKKVENKVKNIKKNCESSGY